MSGDETNVIQGFESRLRLAMIHSDIEELDQLLSDDLIFTTHFGQLIRKKDDLDAHKSGIIKINEAIASDEQILLLKGVAVVSVQMRLSGSINGTPSNGLFRFTRVWAESSKGHWKVVAGQSTSVA